MERLDVGVQCLGRATVCWQGVDPVEQGFDLLEGIVWTGRFSGLRRGGERQACECHGDGERSDHGRPLNAFQRG